MTHSKVRLQRIESIQAFFWEHPNSTFNDCLEAHPLMPKGTLSFTISVMKLMGHLIRNDRGRYSLPSVVCTAKQIVSDFRKYNDQRKSKAEQKQLNIDHNSVLASAPEVNELEKATALLKSHGYKVLKPTTEWLEM
jgi:hypothetical protein